MTTWSDVSDVSTSWSLEAVRHGYMFNRYVDDDYVLGTEVSGPWTDASDVSTTWTAA